MLIADEFSSGLSNLVSGFERDDWPEGLLFHYRKPGHRSENIIKNSELLFASYESLPDKHEIISIYLRIIGLIKKRNSGNIEYLFWN